MKFTFAPEACPLEGYTIKRAIHRGGFGEVYYALSSSGKEVALKLLNNNLEVELRGAAQCLNLKHPNLVTIFDVREDRDGDHWIIMEYIGGRGLHDVLQDYPDGMPMPEVLKWLNGITAGLSFLHDCGIVHRDLKPANVFSDQDIVKIGDVGLSKYISESRRSAQTQSVGTVYYMAPEVAKGRYGREVDVYAVGIMLVEMLTGCVPFDGETTAEILMKHMTAEPDLSEIPAEVRSVVAAALKKDPEKRIQDVEELERQFRASVAGAPAAPPEKTTGFRSTPSKVPRQLPDRTKAAGAFGSLATRWSNLPPPAKWVIGGITAVFLLETDILLYVTSGALRYVTAGALLGGSVYLGYRLVSTLFGSKEDAKANRRRRQPELSRNTPPAPPGPVKPLPAEASLRNRNHRTTVSHAQVHTSVNYTPATPRRLGWRHRLHDVANSLSVSPAAVVLVTLAIFFTTNMLPSITHAVYFAAVTMLASWGLIVSGKICEGRAGDAFLRRLLQGAVGLAVGLAAAGLQQYLMLSTDSFLRTPDAPTEPWVVGRVEVSDGSGFPTTAAFMLFFGLLFAIRRWWRQTDSFRRARFRVSSALFTLLVGAILSGFLPGFPDSLGATWALAISAVVQLSAGWTPHEDRLPAADSPARPATRPEHMTTVHA